jgi:hypothetical protein
MIRRCYDPSHPARSKFSGPAFEVCERWRKDFAAFLKDMGPRPGLRMLERIDKTKGYEPGNCRWSAKEEKTWSSDNALRFWL